MKLLNARNADTPTLCRPLTNAPLPHITSANTAGMISQKAAISNTNSIAHLKMQLPVTMLAILLMTITR